VRHAGRRASACREREDVRPSWLDLVLHGLRRARSDRDRTSTDPTRSSPRIGGVPLGRGETSYRTRSPLSRDLLPLARSSSTTAVLDAYTRAGHGGPLGPVGGSIRTIVRPSSPAARTARAPRRRISCRGFRRLVGEDHRRVVTRRAGDRDALLLASGQLHGCGGSGRRARPPGSRIARSRRVSRVDPR